MCFLMSAFSSFRQKSRRRQAGANNENKLQREILKNIPGFL